MKKESIFARETNSGWVCYLFGSDKDWDGIIYKPKEDKVPNFFVRFMMRVCLGCRWEKLKDNSN